MIRTGSRAVLESFTRRFPRSGIFSSVGRVFRSRFFGIPRASGAGARAQLTAPTCARWRDARVRRRSACTEARHLFSLPADEGTRSEGGVFVSRERLPGGGRPPAGPEEHSFARREPSETRAASRDHGGRAEGEQGPDAGEGASRAPRGRGRGRRAARGPGRWDARAFFRAERGERRSRSPPTDANDAGERRKGPREGAREGARAARERREARGTPSAPNPSRGRVASRTASRPRTRAAPGKIAPTARRITPPPPLRAPRVSTDSILPPVRPTNADDARPEPTPPRRVSPPPPPSRRLRALPRRARARCRSRTRRRPRRRRTRRRTRSRAAAPPTNAADRARPPRDRRRRSSPPTRPRPRDRCDRRRDRDRDQARAGR